MDIPSGIVTFLFTDIEGATGHLEEDLHGAPGVLQRHNRILRDAVEQHEGHIFNRAGDEFAVSFHSAGHALLSAIAVQAALLSERWTDDTPVCVRMALHTGPAQAIDGAYIGSTINRAARLLSGVWAGQIVLSDATRSQLLDELPADVELVELGLFRLGRDYEEQLYQVVAPDLPTDFGPPPVRLPPAQTHPAERTELAVPNRAPDASTPLDAQSSRSPETLAIFISYRREDSMGHAGWLGSLLMSEFGRDHIFMDLDSIEPGEDFRETIRAAVGACDALLALIGPRWLSVTDAGGEQRLDNSNDFVRAEIRAALERGVRVIPVLLHGAAMPPPEHLPDDIRELAWRNAMVLSDDHFGADVALLIRALRRTRPTRVTLPPT
jgi:class 3 adenylate cyclase